MVTKGVWPNLLIFRQSKAAKDSGKELSKISSKAGEFLPLLRPLLREQESSRQSLARLSSRIDALCPDVARIAYGPTNASLDRIDGKLSTSQTSLRGINDELSTIKNSLREINDQLSNSQASLQEALNRNLEAFAGVAALLADIRDSNQAIVSHLTSNNDTPSTS